MRILFDHQIFFLQQRGGISRYFVELYKHLPFAEAKADIIAPFHANTYLEEAGVQATAGLKKRLLCNSHWDKRLAFSYFEQERYLRAHKDAILHETYYTQRMATKHPVVITIHDMIYEVLGDKSEEAQQVIAGKKAAIDRADGIICVSESTQRDVLSIYPQVAGKCKVIYHGVDVPSELPVLKQKAKPYFLFVGNRGWYKNFTTTVKAFAEVLKQLPDIELRCIGGGNFTTEEVKLMQDLQIFDRVTLEKGNDASLFSLYAHAQALLYTSLYEGFGMPVLEAMAMGCPVICSNTSSLPEVAGDAAISIDASSTEQLQQAMLTSCNNSTLRAGLIEKGRARAKQFSWQSCANQTADLYRTFMK